MNVLCVRVVRMRVRVRVRVRVRECTSMGVILVSLGARIIQL